jgi:hypothetical protein
LIVWFIPSFRREMIYPQPELSLFRIGREQPILQPRFRCEKILSQ